MPFNDKVGDFTRHQVAEQATGKNKHRVNDEKAEIILVVEKQILILTVVNLPTRLVKSEICADEYWAIVNQICSEIDETEKYCDLVRQFQVKLSV